MSQGAQLESGPAPAHALDGLLPPARGQWSFTCADKSYWKEAEKHNLGTRHVSSFSCLRWSGLGRVLLVSDRFQYPIRAGVGWVLLARRIPCLYTSVNRLTSFLAVRAMGCLFGKFV